MNDIANKNVGFSTALTSSFPLKPCLNASADVNTRVSDNNNKVPPVPLNGNEEHWLPSFIVDQLYLQMCETGVEDPQYCDKISRYYLEAAKYAGRISAGNFDGPNAKCKPVFEICYKDFTQRLQDELLLLMKESPSTLRRVVQNAIFRIFKARHRMIFHQYIENDGIKWRFVAD
jgi:hypothetical protein